MKRFSMEHTADGHRWLLYDYTDLTGTRLVGWGPWHDNHKDADYDRCKTARGCVDARIVA